MNQTERARFYEGQYLSADDLASLEEEPRVHEARHALGAHTWGIAVGLDLVERTLPSGEVENSIMPGYAWDGYGRPIVVLAPVKISPAKLVNFQGTTAADGVLVKIWIRYDETETGNPAPGFQVCGVEDQHARVVETFAIEVGEPMTGPNDPVSIAGGPVDPLEARSTFNTKAPELFDESVPFQDFPEDAKPRWLIPIGYVRWVKQSGKAGKFGPRIDGGSGSTPKDSDVIRQFRYYIGVVAETVHAPDGAIRLRDRSKDPDPAKTFFHRPTLTEDPANPNDLVWIEGSLRVEGDARIADGQLELRTKAGSDEDTPTLLRRRGDGEKDPGEAGGRRFQAVIGKTNQDANKFSVGPLQASGDQLERLTVMSTGNVGIGNEAPAARVHLKTLTALEEGPESDAIWSNLGENAYYDGGWKRIDSTKAGVNLHMSAIADGTEFRFLRVESDGSDRRNFAAIGTGASYFDAPQVGIGNVSPGAQLHVKTLTVIDEGESSTGTWANFGQNSFYSGSTWLRIDDKKPGTSFHMNPDGDGEEFRFLKSNKSGGVENIAVIGTETSYVAHGRVGIGTTAPMGELDVYGHIRIYGQAFSRTGTVNHGDLIPVPFGTTDDWSIIVTPGRIEYAGFPPGNPGLAMMDFSATADPSKMFYVMQAQYQFQSGGVIDGVGQYLLVPN